ncbi:RNA polymerase sigma factor [Thalassotalea piscium]
MKKPSNPILEQEEKDLIRRLIEEDDSAYEILVRHYSGKMYAVAFRFLKTDHDAQECLQKAFIQVFKNITSFKQSSTLTTWLHRITVNEALMMLRKKKRQHTSSLESFSQHYNEYGERTDFSDNLGQPLATSLEALFEKNETKLSIHEIIYQLPDKYCNVILLRDIQELTTKEVADILAISEASVKTQLHRARLLLKAILEQQDKDNAENNWKVK